MSCKSFLFRRQGSSLVVDILLEYDMNAPWETKGHVAGQLVGFFWQFVLVNKDHLLSHEKEHELCLFAGLSSNIICGPPLPIYM